MYYEEHKRSVVKTISWRVFATLTTASIVYIFTGELILAVSVGGMEVIAKIILYFLHERGWNRINYGRKRIKPFVVWFTGLSGSGKSTLAERTLKYLEKKDLPVQQLDGDILRDVFPKTGFSKEDRILHIKRAGYLASLLEKNNVFVVASFISPYQESRDFARSLCQNFIEVYVNASLGTCERRDPKSLYKKARAGEIKNFTGIDDPYEPPEHPELTIHTDHQTETESFKEIKRVIDHHLKSIP